MGWDKSIPEKKMALVRLIPFSIFWFTWKERNRRAFEGIKTWDRLAIDR